MGGRGNNKPVHQSIVGTVTRGHRGFTLLRGRSIIPAVRTAIADWLQLRCAFYCPNLTCGSEFDRDEWNIVLLFHIIRLRRCDYNKMYCYVKNIRTLKFFLLRNFLLFILITIRLWQFIDLARKKQFKSWNWQLRRLTSFFRKRELKGWLYIDCSK